MCEQVLEKIISGFVYPFKEFLTSSIVNVHVVQPGPVLLFWMVMVVFQGSMQNV